MSVSLPPRGRGTASNPHNRFAAQRIIASDDGWYQEVPPSRATGNKQVRPWRPDLNEMASTKAGAIHIAFLFASQQFPRADNHC